MLNGIFYSTECITMYNIPVTKGNVVRQDSVFNTLIGSTTSSFNVGKLNICVNGKPTHWNHGVEDFNVLPMNSKLLIHLKDCGQPKYSKQIMRYFKQSNWSWRTLHHILTDPLLNHRMQFDLDFNQYGELPIEECCECECNCECNYECNCECHYECEDFPVTKKLTPFM